MGREFNHFLSLIVLMHAVFVSCTLNNAETCTCHPLQTITFGQTAPLSGTDGALTGAMIRDGLLAAFKEFNEDGSQDKKFLLALQSLDDTSTPTTAATNAQNFAKNPSIFGILGTFGSATTEAVASVAIANDLPVLGVYGAMAYRQPFTRFVINLRASFVDESAALVEFLVGQSKRRIALFTQDDSLGEASITGVNAALSSNNLYLHSLARCSADGGARVWADEAQAAITIMTNSKSQVAPDAVVVAAQTQASAIFIALAKEKWPTIHVACLSTTTAPQLVAQLQSKNPEAETFTNLFFAQVVPEPTNSSVPIVARYHTALAALNTTPAYSALSLEGYIIGRLVIAALERIRGYNYTHEGFVSALYDKGHFNFDEFRFGPFLAARTDGGCNQGMHEVIMTELTSSHTLKIRDSFTFNTCGYQPKVWKTITLGQSCTFNGSQASRCQGFRDGVRASFKVVNDAGGIRGTTKLELVTKDDGASSMKALLNNINFVGDPNIFGLIGSSSLSITQAVDEVTRSHKVLLGAFTGETSLRDPFQRQVINFRASTDDEVFAIVHHLFYYTKFTKVSVLYEATSFGTSRRFQLATALLEKRWNLLSESGFTTSNLTQSIDSLFNDAGSTLQVIVFIGLEDVIADVLVRVHARDRKILVFGLSETVTDKLLNGSAISDKVNWNNFLLTSVVPDVFDLSIEVVRQYTTAIANLDIPPQPTSAGLEGFIVGQLLATALNRIMGKALTVENFLDSLYANGNFNLFGLRCGPLLEGNSNNSPRTSCNQCMKNVYLTVFKSTINEDQRTFSFEDTCGYVPFVSLDFQLSGMRLVLSTMAGIGIGYTVIIMMLVVFYRNNPHVRATSYKFTLVSCVGGILCYVGIFVIYPVPTDTSCALEPWIADLAFVTLFGPIFAKTYRIDRIFNNKKIKHQVISDGQVFRIVIMLLLVFMSFQVIYTLMNRPYMHEVITPSRTRFEECTTDSQTFDYIDAVLKGLVLIWGCFLCQRVYKINGKFARFNESKQLVVCIYHTTFLAMCMLLLGMTTKDNPNLHFACVSGILLENTLLVETLLYGHPVYKALTNKPLDDIDDESSNNTSTGTNHVTGTATNNNNNSTMGTGVGGIARPSKTMSGSATIKRTVVSSVPESDGIAVAGPSPGSAEKAAGGADNS